MSLGKIYLLVLWVNFTYHIAFDFVSLTDPRRQITEVTKHYQFLDTLTVSHDPSLFPRGQLKKSTQLQGMQKLCAIYSDYKG